MSDEDQKHASTPEELGKALEEFTAAGKVLLERTRGELLAGTPEHPALAEQIQAALDEANRAKGELLNLRNEYFSEVDGQKPLADQMRDKAGFIQEAESGARKSSEDIGGFTRELLGYEENGVQHTGIRHAVADQAAQLKALYSSIFEQSDPNQQPLSQQVGKFLEEFSSKKNEIDTIRQEIVSYQTVLLGELTDGRREKGIKGEVDGYVQDLRALLDHNTSAQATLLNKVEDLLEGASTAALASAFNAHKSSYDTDNRKWGLIFNLALFGIMALSLITLFQGIVHKSFEWYEELLFRVPILTGAVWFAIYSSKQRSQNKRLQEEYAYKEDVAKIYYALKKEIENLGDTEVSKNLREEVIKVLVSTVALNPSSTLESAAHNERMPLLDALKGIKDGALEIGDNVKLKFTPK